MSLALRRVKVYGKLAAIGVVVVSIFLIGLYNRHNTADVWFFGKYEQVNVLKLILGTAVGSIASFWVITWVWGIVREMRALHKERQAAAKLEEQKRLAAELAEREKRIDEKIRRSIADPE